MMPWRSFANRWINERPGLRKKLRLRIRLERKHGFLILILFLIVILTPNSTMKLYFDHEKLDAYKKALAFAEWAEPVLVRLPKSVAVQNQLDRARTSIVLNIPEGNGRFTSADRCKFFDIAPRSALAFA